MEILKEKLKIFLKIYEDDEKRDEMLRELVCLLIEYNGEKLHKNDGTGKVWDFFIVEIYPELRKKAKKAEEYQIAKSKKNRMRDCV